jgi:DNA-binding transcriptional LysR family regulator
MTSGMADLDLNLLVSLEALLDERHVSRAGDRVGLTQSAMSRALHRLRATFGDDLLVRDGSNYRLTPEAERINRELSPLMSELRELFSQPAFDPGSALDVFRLSGSDYLTNVLAPVLLEKVVTEAGRSLIQFSLLRRSPADELASGRTDLMVVGGPAPTETMSEVLFHERLVCLIDQDHPLAGDDALLLADYLKCGHIAVDTASEQQNAIDPHLAAEGHQRRIEASFGYHSAAALAVEDTDLVLTLPERQARRCAVNSRLRTLSAPPSIPAMPLRMVWHPRLDNDLGHRWLRDTVRAAARRL